MASVLLSADSRRLSMQASTLPTPPVVGPPLAERSERRVIESASRRDDSRTRGEEAGASMASGISVGGAEARPGKLVHGTIEALELPSGLRERIPVIVGAGRHDGPTMWLTANIHGAELTGIGVIHRLMTEDL